jgi:hypothetical protein
MLPYSELEYGGVVDKMKQLYQHFIVRKAAKPARVNGQKKKAA